MIHSHVARRLGCVVRWFSVLLSIGLAWAVPAISAESSRRANLNPCTEPGALASFKPLSEIHATSRIEGETLPQDCSEGLFTTAAPMSQAAMGRDGWTDSTMAWAPTELFFHPLYFDEPALERYGQTRNPVLQPAISGIHFFGSAALWPLELAAEQPCRRVSQLGYYRPGSAAPPVRDRMVRREFDTLWLYPREWISDSVR
jgi:hypothetical protein